MLGDPLLHHLRIGFLLDNHTRLLASLGQSVLAIHLLPVDLFRALLSPLAPELELLFFLELIDNIIRIDLHLLQNVILVRLGLDLDCFVYHLAQLPVALVQFPVADEQGFVPGGVRFVLVLQLVDLVLQLVYFLTELLLPLREFPICFG